MLFAAIFSLAQRAFNFDTSAVQNVCNSRLCDRLRSFAITWKQLSLRLSAICDLRSAIVCDRLRSYGNQPSSLRDSVSFPERKFQVTFPRYLSQQIAAVVHFRHDSANGFAVVCHITPKHKREMVPLNNNILTSRRRTTVARSRRKYPHAS